MTDVRNQQGDSAATANGMTRYSFSGKAPDQYEYLPAIGEKRTMTVEVQCTAHEDKATANEGIQRIAKFKVTNAEVGKLAAKAPEDPTLFGDPDAEPRADLGDYVPEEPDGDWAPPADQVTAAHEGEGRAPENVRQMFSDAAN